MESVNARIAAIRQIVQGPSFAGRSTMAAEQALLLYNHICLMPEETRHEGLAALAAFTLELEAFNETPA